MRAVSVFPLETRERPSHLLTCFAPLCFFSLIPPFVFHSRRFLPLSLLQHSSYLSSTGELASSPDSAWRLKREHLSFSLVQSPPFPLYISPHWPIYLEKTRTVYIYQTLLHSVPQHSPSLTIFATSRAFHRMDGHQSTLTPTQ